MLLLLLVLFVCLLFCGRVGYKDKEVTVNTKKEKQVDTTGGAERYHDDEQPVIIKGSGISDEEYQQYLTEREKGNLN